MYQQKNTGGIRVWKKGELILSQDTKGIRESMDKFFSQNNCDRCGKDLKGGRIMSAFSEECICIDCSDKEKQDPDYEKARIIENEEIKKGNYNFKGIRNKLEGKQCIAK